MKKMLIYSFLLFCSGMMANCDGDTYTMHDKAAPNATITTDVQSINVPGEGGTYTIQVSTTGKEWNAYTNDKWFTVSSSNTNSCCANFRTHECFACNFKCCTYARVAYHIPFVAKSCVTFQPIRYILCLIYNFIRDLKIFIGCLAQIIVGFIRLTYRVWQYNHLCLCFYPIAFDRVGIM